MVDRPPWSPDVVPFSRIEAGKPPFWASKDAAALERVNIVSDTFSGAWRRVISSMGVFPLYNGRSGGDLSIGGVSVRVDAWNDDFEDRGGSVARGGAWATKPRTPVARESAWRLQ